VESLPVHVADGIVTLHLRSITDRAVAAAEHLPGAIAVRNNLSYDVVSTVYLSITLTFSTQSCGAPVAGAPSFFLFARCAGDSGPVLAGGGPKLVGSASGLAVEEADERGTPPADL
jgi:hypothetical protein